MVNPGFTECRLDLSPAGKTGAWHIEIVFSIEREIPCCGYECRDLSCV